jgi:uncharacterized protein
MFIIDRAPQRLATLVLAHGAGANMESRELTQLAHALAERGLDVVRFDFPYMVKKRETGRRGPPDNMKVLEQAYRDVLTTIDRSAPLFIGGKSMGGRVSTHIADSAGVCGVIAFGYPFHPPKQLEKLRVAHLTVLQTPCLIVQGTRDPFGTPSEVATYTLSPAISVHWLEDGDHSFAPRKASGRTLAQNIAEAADATRAFVQGEIARG